MISAQIRPAELSKATVQVLPNKASRGEITPSGAAGYGILVQASSSEKSQSRAYLAAISRKASTKALASCSESPSVIKKRMLYISDSST
ncbi:hypothetical protein SDC9_206748 [bioreactor metagenome]|uniref:Uncharacterized protein n=1 Tax=bioreactor metagenome TaxID=1076179 RepID=A0A645J7B7_9ZZZZ